MGKAASKAIGKGRRSRSLCPCKASIWPTRGFLAHFVIALYSYLCRRCRYGCWDGTTETLGLRRWLPDDEEDEDEDEPAAATGGATELLLLVSAIGLTVASIGSH